MISFVATCDAYQNCMHPDLPFIFSLFIIYLISLVALAFIIKRLLC